MRCALGSLRAGTDEATTSAVATARSVWPATCEKSEQESDARRDSYRLPSMVTYVRVALTGGVTQRARGLVSDVFDVLARGVDCFSRALARSLDMIVRVIGGSGHQLLDMFHQTLKVTRDVIGYVSCHATSCREMVVMDHAADAARRAAIDWKNAAYVPEQDGLRHDGSQTRRTADIISRSELPDHL
jgi:hypothetical protein